MHSSFSIAVYCMYMMNKRTGITHHDKTEEADGDIPFNVDCINFFQRNAVLKHAVLLAFYLYLTNQNQALRFR